MTLKKTIIVFLALSILGATVHFATPYSHLVVTPLPQREEVELNAEHAANLEADGVMKASTYMQMASICQEANKTKEVSDLDLTFIFFVMEHPLTNADDAKWMSQGDGLIILASLPYTPAQSNRVFHYVEPLLKSDHVVVRDYAVRMFGELGDKRIVPELLPLLHDPNPAVVSMDRKVLAKLGHRI